jgi:ABC-2 type transport system permease protein
LDNFPSAVSRSEALRSFKIAAWLGWQITSNWTDPFLFTIYSIIRPISRAAILVVMYGVITQGNFTNPLFPYIYLGNAFYTYVFTVMNGVAWAVIDDREHYKTLKYMYIAPIRIPFYLLGRGVAGFLTASLSVVITILAGVLFLHVSIDPLHANWLMFFVALFIGVIMLSLMGLLLAAVSLLVVRHAGSMAEGVSGVLFLFCGAIYPLEVLPKWLQPLGFAIPITYWLELMRRSLVGSVAQAFPTLARFNNLELLGILLGLTFLFGTLSIFVFRYCDRLARERGFIDRTTNY